MSQAFQFHHFPKPTLAQRDNLLDLARHLITRAYLLRRWDKLVFSKAERERAPLGPDAVVEGRKLPAMMPLGFGPLVGVPPRAGETWSQYGERAFAMPYGSALEAWVQDAAWTAIDPTPIGVGLRIAQALEFGIPSNWQNVRWNAQIQDYAYSHTNWEQLELTGWRDGPGRAEWEIEQPLMVAAAYGGRPT
ncbi:hypothetical protein [Devosia sp. Root635]|uniref:hypothetical protein n=1 Tax=Devosia sp. Root635 TaxID=1736575 RepID=UPI0007007EFA|nr:hypothetical protein [Devosia sp. Root635]KRA48797.1 hypothetical protein ASD80_16940 [Devosia sp. Root635]